jgi:hypothetical protein
MGRAVVAVIAMTVGLGLAACDGEFATEVMVVSTSPSTVCLEGVRNHVTTCQDVSLLPRFVTAAPIGTCLSVTMDQDRHIKLAHICTA